MKVRIKNPDLGLDCDYDYVVLDEINSYQIEHPDHGPLMVRKEDCEIIDES